MHSPLHSIADEVSAFIRSPAGPSSGETFDALATRLLAAQHASNPAYAAWCAASRRPVLQGGPAHLYPAVPTEAFKHAAFSCIPQGSHTTEFHSSGTTAHVPSRHLHHADSLALYKVSALAAFDTHLMRGVVPGGHASASRPILLSLTPPLDAAPRSSLVHMIHWAIQRHGGPGSGFVGRRGPDGSWEIDAQAALATFASARATRQAVVLMGTAFNLVHLVDVIGNVGAEVLLPAGSRLMETGGYKGRSRELSRDELHASASVALGLPREAIVTEYGMTELSSQAYDRCVGQHGTAGDVNVGILSFPHWARARVVSPETGKDVDEGQAGIVEILDLANVWSVAMVRTSDLAIRRGDGFELLGRARAAEPRGCSRMTA